MTINKKTIRFFGITLTFLLLLVFITPALAFEPMGGDRVVIEEGQVIDDDLYVSANTFILNGTVKGDLIAFGNTVIIGPKGVVEDDLLAAGQAIVINGKVGDSARIAGAMLQLGNSAQIGGDLLTAGYSTEAQSGSSVGKDVVATGSQAVLSGDIARNLKVYAGGVQLNGRVGGDMLAAVGNPEDIPPVSPITFMPLDPQVSPPPTVKGGLTIGQDAEIGGDLTYTASQDASIPSGVVNGKLTYNEPTLTEAEQAPPPTAGEKALNWFFDFLRKFVALLIIGLLLMWLLPDVVRKSSQLLQSKPLPSFLWGFLFHFLFFFGIFLLIVIVIILASLLGALTLGSLVLTIIAAGAVVVSSLLLAFQISFAYIAKLILAYLIGYLILSKIYKGSAENRFYPVVLGVFLLVLAIAIVELIPVLGGLLVFLVTMFGLGALVLLIWGYVKGTPTELGVENVVSDEPATVIMEETETE
jgi:cytoskeletal protein CcmA (bactofilin family)